MSKQINDVIESLMAIRVKAEACGGHCDGDPCIWCLAQQGLEAARVVREAVQNG
jgi:hypothetical protein